MRAPMLTEDDNEEVDDLDPVFGVRTLSEEVSDPSSGLTTSKELLGSGHSAKVFRGRLLNGRPVAVKVLHSGTTEEKSKDLTRELELLERVQHPGLVAFLGSFTDSHNCCNIIMELCEGPTLFHLLHVEGIRLDWWQKQKVVHDIVLAMNYLHGLDPVVMHRDLKSLNVLFTIPVETETQVPRVKVTDLGLSRTLDPSASALTQHKGTIQWMAPEILFGDIYDEKVDVYSLGMVLYELAAEEVPFLEECENARFPLMLAQGMKPDLKLILPDCPAFLSDLMKSCWTTEAYSRPSFHQIQLALPAWEDC